MKTKFMLTIFTAVFMAAQIFANPAWAENSSRKAPITRVVNVHHNKLTDVNVAALEQSAQLLKADHPELAEELEEMAASALA